MRELIATIYDSDASLHGAFSCAPGWTMEREASGKSNYNACYYPTAKYPTTSVADTVIPCIGVTTGMVESILDPKTKKMKLTAKGQKCFGDQADEAFAALFTATPGINESYYFVIPFYKNYYGKLEFDSDYQQSKGAKVPGGFYPAEVPPDDDMMLSERLPAAEGKRRAEGPVFYCSDPSKNSKTPDGLRTIDATQKVPAYKLICNGPGWDKGYNCNGLFDDGYDVISMVRTENRSAGLVKNITSGGFYAVMNAMNGTWVGVLNTACATLLMYALGRIHGKKESLQQARQLYE